MRQMRQIILAAAGSLLISMPFACAQTHAPAAPAATHVNVSPALTRKAGHALKHIIAIQENYRAKMKSAVSPKQKDAQRRQVVEAETMAIRQQGLTVAQYSRVITAARTDKKVRQELFAAADFGRK